MSRTLFSLCMLASLGFALAACSSDSKNAVENLNIIPKDYQSELLLALTGELEDPINIKDAGITEPALRVASREQRYVVCVRYNARNFGGQYAGVKEKIGYFYGGHLNQLLEADQKQCAGVAYRPWPELEKFCVAGRCPK